MTDKIQHIIESIHLKCKTLHENLVSERSIRIEHEAEIVTLKNEISILKNQNYEIEQLKAALKIDLETIMQKGIDEKESVLNDRNEEIDELVREIEHCIKQLKQ
jgi:hypothetical protein